ncbi:MAG: peptide ABC transporter substrate-binding protein [Oscillospiraceae bacterium]|jgi:oligopeptide transport system substrate-binding protein|nr:peptide ABC transporter substrate-binding protein [Oscillospiraceae bacterium]
MKKVIAILLAALLALPLFSFAAMAEGEEISMFWGGGTPLSIDPALNSASAGSNIIRLAHVGLMAFRYVDGEARLAPELAESYTVSEDGTTYVFTLREGLKWSDGTDFTASQLKASWDRASSADLGADYGFMYDVIEGYADGNLNVVADDAARTITVKLNSPTPYFLELAAFPTFYPVRVDLADNGGIWATNPETYVGLGAFKMTKYAVDDVIAYEKNPYYWDADSVSIGKVNCLLSEDNVAILAAYENGVASFIDSLDPTEFDRLNATYPGELNFGAMLGTYYILFNVHKDYSPAGKQLTVQEQSKARFAIGQLINRQELCTYVTKDGRVPATGFYPATLGDGLNADVRASETYTNWYEGTDTPSDINPDYTVDQVTAAQMLIDLGYAYSGSIEGGDLKFTDFPSIEFSFNNSGANALIIQYVQETWNSFGIPATINTEAWATLQQNLKEGNAEAARMGWIADFNDCVNFLEIVISNSGNNYPRVGKDLGTYTKASEVTKDAGLGAYWGLNGDQTWADAFDAIVAKIKSTTDPEERAQLCAEGERVLMATGGVAPLQFYTRPFMLKPNVKNLIMMPTGDVIWSFVTIE